MKKLILISVLLFSFNSWADITRYKGNNFEECKAIASIMSFNKYEYAESMKTCNLLKPKKTFSDKLIEAAVEGIAEGLVEGLVEKAIGCDEDEVKRVRQRTRSHPLGERQETIVYKEDC